MKKQPGILKDLNLSNPSDLNCLYRIAVSFSDEFMIEQLVDFEPRHPKSADFFEFFIDNITCFKHMTKLNVVNRYFPSKILLACFHEKNDWANFKRILDSPNSSIQIWQLVSLIVYRFNDISKRVIQNKYIPNWKTYKFYRSQSFKGDTLLHFAIKRKNNEMLLWLLMNGADYMQVDFNGRLPIELSLKCGNAFCEYFNKYRSDGRDDQGNTMLHVAVQKNSLPLVNWLIRHKVLCFQLNNEGKLPIDYTSYGTEIYNVLDKAAARVLQAPLD